MITQSAEQHRVPTLPNVVDEQELNQLEDSDDEILFLGEFTPEKKENSNQTRRLSREMSANRSFTLNPDEEIDLFPEESASNPGQSSLPVQEQSSDQVNIPLDQQQSTSNAPETLPFDHQNISRDSETPDHQNSSNDLSTPKLHDCGNESLPLDHQNTPSTSQNPSDLPHQGILQSEINFPKLHNKLDGMLERLRKMREKTLAVLERHKEEEEKEKEQAQSKTPLNQQNTNQSLIHLPVSTSDVDYLFEDLPQLDATDANAKNSEATNATDANAKNANATNATNANATDASSKNTKATNANATDANVDAEEILELPENETSWTDYLLKRVKNEIARKEEAKNKKENQKDEEVVVVRSESSSSSNTPIEATTTSTPIEATTTSTSNRTQPNQQQQQQLGPFAHCVECKTYKFMYSNNHCSQCFVQNQQRMRLGLIGQQQQQIGPLQNFTTQPPQHQLPNNKNTPISSPQNPTNQHPSISQLLTTQPQQHQQKRTGRCLSCRQITEVNHGNLCFSCWGTICANLQRLRMANQGTVTLQQQHQINAQLFNLPSNQQKQFPTTNQQPTAPPFIPTFQMQNRQLNQTLMTNAQPTAPFVQLNQNLMANAQPTAPFMQLNQQFNQQLNQNFVAIQQPAAPFVQNLRMNGKFCSECKVEITELNKTSYCKTMCKRCNQKSRTIQCPSCSKIKVMFKNGVCQACFHLIFGRKRPSNDEALFDRDGLESTPKRSNQMSCDGSSTNATTTPVPQSNPDVIELLSSGDEYE